MTHFSKNQQFPITKDAAIISEMRSLFPNFKEDLHILLAGMAGCSPFLFELIKKEVNWITNVFAMELSPEKEVSNEVLKSSDIPKGVITPLNKCTPILKCHSRPHLRDAFNWLS